jgi:TM2 domain-containing membrane protein YozV
MIRFSCPGCATTYTVDDVKGGKTGKCPKCQSQFTIPMPEGITAPPVPAPANSNEPVEIAPCPGCQARLSVAPSDLGIDVECPYCKTVYTAKKPGTGSLAPLPPPAPPRLSSLEKAGGRDRRDDDEDERPSRRRRDEGDELDERPSRRRRRDDEDEDDEDDRPRKKKRRKRTAGIESKRVVAGVLALLLGQFGVHKFYLGYTGAGILQIVLTLFTCFVGGLIPFAEGIIYLTKTDDEFIETYQLGEKQWF